MPVEPFAGQWQLAMTFRSNKHWEDLRDFEREHILDQVEDSVWRMMPDGGPPARFKNPTSTRLFTANMWLFKFVISEG